MVNNEVIVHDILRFIFDVTPNPKSCINAKQIASFFGWTPILWKQIREKKCFYVTFFFLLFVVDLADAIFDLVLSIQTMMRIKDGDEEEVEQEGARIDFGILLLVATILGRFISGLYGRNVLRNSPSEEENLVTFCMMEVTVFFLEDGAAILVLANSSGGMDIVETISMYLTLICGICYIGYFIVQLSIHMYDKGLDCVLIQGILITAGSITFQCYIFTTQVLMSKEDDAPLSGTLEIAAFVVYGVTAFVWGCLATWAFTLE